MNRKCVTIEIQANDLDCESEESFLLHLEIPIGREYVELVYQTTTGVILDSNSRTYMTAYHCYIPVPIHQMLYLYISLVIVC